MDDRVIQFKITGRVDVENATLKIKDVGNIELRDIKCEKIHNEYICSGTAKIGNLIHIELVDMGQGLNPKEYSGQLSINNGARVCTVPTFWYP